MPEQDDQFVKKAVTDLMTEAARPLSLTIGQSVSDIYFGLIGSRTQTYASNRMAEEIVKREKFIENLVEKSKEIDETDFKEPEMYIVGPAIEYATKFSMDNETLKEMFERLILSSMQFSKSKYVHPSFTEIIKQLSPLDAVNLSIFKTEKSIPIANYRLERSDKSGGIDLKHNVFLANADQTDIDLQASSLSNLNRVGLISLDYTSSLVNESLYEPFEQTYFFKNYKLILTSEELKRMRNLENFSEITAEKGIARLTPLGDDFVRIILS